MMPLFRIGRARIPVTLALPQLVRRISSLTDPDAEFAITVM